MSQLRVIFNSEFSIRVFKDHVEQARIKGSLFPPCMEFIDSSNASRWIKNWSSFKEEREGKEKEEDEEKEKEDWSCGSINDK